MFTETNFKCVHCGKSFGDHQARTYNCPRTGRGSFKGFNPSHVYSPNRDKPELDQITL